MKKKIAILMAALSVFALTSFAACGDESENSQGGTQGGSQSGSQNGSQQGGDEHTAHTWGDWSITVPATCTSAGERTRGCTGCDETETEPIAKLGHTWNTSLSSNYEKHWTECTVCGEKKDEVSHTFTEWASDGFRHWHACPECKTPETQSGVALKSQHVMEQGVCTECEYEQGAYTQGLTYELNGNAYTVTGVGTATDGDIVIPAFINDVPITKIADSAFKNQSFIESVVIPDSVDTIESWAFENCSHLESITLGNSIRTLERGVFWDTDPTYVNFTGSVGDWCRIEFEAANSNPMYYTGIDHRTLYFNKKPLTDVVIPDDITEINPYAFYKCASIEAVVMGKNVAEIGESAFEECTELCDLDFNESAPSIGRKAFYKCALVNLQFSDGVTLIDQEAFSECDALETVSIPGSVTTIGASAFYQCDELLTVEIGAGVEQIEGNAFNGCLKLENLTIGEGLTSIGSSAFQNCEKLKNFTVPQSLTTIGGNAFSGCKALTSFTIGENVTAVQYNAFMNSGLTDLTIAGGTKELTIGNSAFNYCDLIELTLPDRVTSIGSDAFKGNFDLETVSIGKGLTSIGSEAFGSCRALETITVSPENPSLTVSGKCFINKGTKTILFGLEGFTIPEDANLVTKIGGKAFAGNGVTSVTVPNTVTEIGKEAFRKCEQLETVILSDAVTTIDEFTFAECSNLSSVTFGNQTETIGKSAFKDCASLGAITLPNTVTTIGNSAFVNCINLETTIGDHILSIGTSAFSGCLNVQTKTNGIIYLGDGNKKWVVGRDDAALGSNRTIEIPEGVVGIIGGAFSGCAAMTAVELPSTLQTIGDNAFSECTNLTEVVIPDNVTTIGNYAFYNCSSLHTVTIGDKVNYIGQKAFSNCSSLTEATFKQTTNWRYCTEYSPNGYAIASDKFATPQTAATNMKNTWFSSYSSYYLKRTES